MYIVSMIIRNVGMTLIGITNYNDETKTVVRVR